MRSRRFTTTGAPSPFTPASTRPLPKIPPTSGELDDDDCDALEIVEAAGRNPFFYYSVDHEAPAGGLNPGVIYTWNPVLAREVVVVNAAVHLGVPAGVDLRDFEFVWLKNTAVAKPGPALDAARLPDR